MKGTPYVVLLSALTSCLPSAVLADAPSRRTQQQPSVSQYYEQSSQTIPIGSPGDYFRISRTEIGFRVQFSPFGLIVFERDSGVSLFGRGSRSIRVEGSAQDVRNYDYDQIPLEELWDLIDYRQSPASSVTLQNQRGRKLSVPAEAVRKHLRKLAHERRYQVPLETLLASHADGFVKLRQEMFSIDDPIESQNLFGDIQSLAGGVVDPNQLSDLQDFFNNLWLTYGDLVTSYLNTISSATRADFHGTVRMDVNAGLELSHWDFDIRNQEAGFMIALPRVRLPWVGGQVEVLAGMGSKAEYAVFRVAEVVGRATVEVNGELSATAYNDAGEPILSASELISERRDFEVPFNFENSPLILESPTHTYRLHYVGLGYYRPNRTRFEVRTSIRRGSGVESASMAFTQRIAGPLSFHLSADGQKIATTTVFTRHNIPHGILQPIDVANLNKQVYRVRDYITQSRFRMGLEIGRNLRMNLAEVQIGGPALIYEGGAQSSFKGILAQVSVLHQRYFIPGIRSKLRFRRDLLPEQFWDFREDSKDLEYRGFSELEDGRIQKTSYRIGVGCDVPMGSFVPSIDVCRRRIETVNAQADLRRLQIPLLKTNAQIGVFLQRNLELNETEGAFQIRIGNN